MSCYLDQHETKIDTDLYETTIALTRKLTSIVIFKLGDWEKNTLDPL